MQVDANCGAANAPHTRDACKKARGVPRALHLFAVRDLRV